MKRLLPFLTSLGLCLSKFLIADEGHSDLLEVESQQCEYDGKKLQLNGKISLVHELGKMSAEEATLYPNSNDKKLSIGLLKINKNVVITSKEGSELICDAAILNYKTMQANFTSIDPASFVTFLEYPKFTSDSESKPKAFFSLKSRSMDALIGKEIKPDKNSKSQSFLKEIIAHNDVSLEYKDFTANADKAVYIRSVEISPEEITSNTSEQSTEKTGFLKNIPGKITFSMNQPGMFCSINSSKGDHIHSPTLSFDTIKQWIHFEMPQGKVQIQQNPVESDLTFSADTLLWDLNRDQLRLTKNVTAEVEGKGMLTTDQELEVNYHSKEGKRQLHSIHSTGFTTLTSPEKQKGFFHFLYCSGNLHVNHDQLTTTFESPLSAQGMVLPEDQVVFRDSLGEMHADKVTLYYQNVDGKISPLRLLAEGNVYLLDRKGTPANEDAPLTHYALADKIKYEFVTKEALFTSAKKKRVLFYDKTKNLQISAPALKLKRDGTNQKESIQGMGDVRFSFLENEVERLQDRFESLPHRY